MTELIRKKRNGGHHSREELDELMSGFVNGSIPDYQVAAWLMAVCFNGLDEEETAALTDIMMNSGEVLDLSSIPGHKVDKHSTGGVGDKTTLVVAPLVAAAGLPVAKMSGRGLGHTGGTLDKLESIPGLNVNLSPEQFVEQVKRIRLAIGAQSSRLVPADKKLYALRDVTATVDQVSLIASSIMSKKLACGAEAIVIDLKVGRGAFMKTVAEAEQLAQVMQGIATRMGRRLTAVLSDMNQPLGMTIGNALEVYEAIRTLQGQGPEDLTEVCLELASHMLLLGNMAHHPSEAKEKLRNMMEDGQALAAFRQFVEAQGGDTSFVDMPHRLLGRPDVYEFKASKTGTIISLDALFVGMAAMKLGAGRETKESIIDPVAGIVLHKKRGDKVAQGETLSTLYASDIQRFDTAVPLLEAAWNIEERQAEESPLIIKVLEG